MCPETEFGGPLEHFFKTCPGECEQGWKLPKNLKVWEEGRRNFVLLVLSVYHFELSPAPSLPSPSSSLSLYPLPFFFLPPFFFSLPLLFLLFLLLCLSQSLSSLSILLFDQWINLLLFNKIKEGSAVIKKS